MIQDIFPHILNNHYNPSIKASEQDILLCVDNGSILLEEEAYKNLTIVFPKIKDVGTNNNVYLFSIDRTKFFLCNEQLENIPSGYVYIEERNLRIEGIKSSENLFACITGKHLADWYRDNKYCGRCGQKLIHSDMERAMVCPNCKNTIYPRIMPAVIVGVINGDKLLLTKYRTGFKYNALIAGFVEIGETVEETVIREVKEETGINVKNIRYYKSQPWGCANDILLGFYCDLDGDEIIHIDSNELKYAEWVKREDIILQPGEFSLTNEMMKMFKEGRIWKPEDSY